MRFIKASAVFILSFCLILGFQAVPIFAAAGETPALTLTGTPNASSVLKNIEFTDVRSSNSWTRSAIYESAALELMKGNNRIFGLNNNLTIEQALAVGYNAVGREAEAQQAAEMLDLARSENNRLNPAPRMWSDGYIQLAFNDGVISFQDYNDALYANQSNLNPTSFNRAAYATREQVADYLAKILGLEPVHSQTRIFNSYNDWTRADPHKVPFIEAILQNRIMSDDGNGNFRPLGYVTRGEMAQILVNAEPLIFQRTGFNKMKGTVESISLNQDLSSGEAINTYTINIRNSNGDLHQLTSMENRDGAYRNEQTGSVHAMVMSSVVNRNNVLGLTGSLKTGDFINYFVNPDEQVPYIQVINPETNTRYFIGKVISADHERMRLEFASWLELPFADIRMADNKTLSKIQPTQSVSFYSVSRGVRAYNDTAQGGFDLVVPDGYYVISVVNGVVDSLTQTNMGLMEASGFVSGVVREVNPSLGYITLYFSDGAGASPDFSDSLTRLRTYSFAYDIPITRDGRPSSLESVQPGDNAFIKLGEDGYMEKLSTQSYYKPVYGVVHMKGPANLMLRLEDGTYQNIPISAGVPVYRNDRPVALSQVLEGDRVKALVQTDGMSIHVAGIDLLKDPKPISAIYRGNMEFYDDMNNALALSGVEEFVNGRWEYIPANGMKTFTYSREYKDRPAGRISGKAYIAVQEDINGSDSIMLATYRGMPQYESIFTDNILALSNTLGRLELENHTPMIGFDAGTIAVKDGRLVDVSSLDIMDPVQISADKPIGSGVLMSQVIVSDTKAGSGALTIYRGRIKLVDPLKSFTVESFAELTGTSWSFSNTPKTFDIDLATTRLLETDGTGNMRAFDESYVSQSVYIVTDGAKTLLVSTVPYADVHERGRVADLTGTTGFSLKEAMAYDNTRHIWESVPNRDVHVPAGAIILKDGHITDSASIRPGDTVRIVSNSASHDGIIMIID